MTRFEYKVQPAPAKGRKSPGVKSPEARFAFALQECMNEMAAEGWEYQRADILPSEERQGLTSSHTVYRSVLVFRRPVPADDKQPDDAIDAGEKEDIAAEPLTEAADPPAEAEAQATETGDATVLPDAQDDPHEGEPEQRA